MRARATTGRERVEIDTPAHRRPTVPLAPRWQARRDADSVRDLRGVRVASTRARRTYARLLDARLTWQARNDADSLRYVLTTTQRLDHADMRRVLLLALDDLATTAGGDLP